MRRNVVVVSVLAVLCAALMVGGTRPGPLAAQGTPPPGGHPLVGSWQIAAGFAGGEAGQPVAELTSLLTFTADGNVLVANPIQLPDVPASAGLFFTEGQGTWAATGARSGDVTFVYLTLDQTGHLTTTNTVRMRIDLDAGGAGLSGEFVLDTLSVESGQPFSPQARGTLTGTRIEVVAIDASMATTAAGTPTP